MRVSAMLFAILILCALGVVTSQHQARSLFIDLQSARDQARDLDIEFGRLQLEQSTWATHARIERIASKQLGML